MQRLNLRILNICVIDDRDPYSKALEPQRGDVLKVARTNFQGGAGILQNFQPLRFRIGGVRTALDPPLYADFAAGAIAVKICKVMGMEIKSKVGGYAMPDDPAFEPVYRDIAADNRTVGGTHR